MQFPPIKKIQGAAGPGSIPGAGDNYVKNIKKNPQAKPGVVSGLGIQGGSIPAEFRQTMKHNNSNQSISGKKFVGGIKKPGDNSITGNAAGVAGVVIQGNVGGNAGTKANKNYMSPYSQKIVQKP